MTVVASTVSPRIRHSIAFQLMDLDGSFRYILIVENNYQKDKLRIKNSVWVGLVASGHLN